MKNRFPAKKNRGAALIVAIMIVALVTVLSVEIYWHFNLAMGRSGSRTFGVQARAYLDAMEGFARGLLKTDLEESQIDHLEELWAIEQPPFPTEEGYVGGRLEDAQGRFNLNLLQQSVPKNPNGSFTTSDQRYTVSQKRFIRLLQTIPLGNDAELMDQTTAEAITEAIIDWLDADSELSGFNGGAEADYYSRLEPPMTIGNAAMLSVSELSLVKGMIPELYDKLLPLVIALPPNVGMNINTLKPELFRILNHNTDLRPLSMEDTQELFQLRGNEEEGFFTTVQGFNQAAGAIFKGSGGQSIPRNPRDPGGPGANAPGGAFDASLTVKSEYFLFFGEAMVAEQILRSQSMLMRTQQGVFTIRRTDANF